MLDLGKGAHRKGGAYLEDSDEAALVLSVYCVSHDSSRLGVNANWVS